MAKAAQIHTLEDQILASCKTYLTLCKNLKLLIFKRIHVMPIVRKWTFRPCCKSRVPIVSQNSDMIGMTDLLIWIKNGPILAIELKTESNELTKEQRFFKEDLEEIGHKHYVIRHVDELIKILEEHGVKV